MISFGRGICNDHQSATRREWLVSNGIGGYASGTVSGILTRSYHGMLIAALTPPLNRTVLVSKIDEIAAYRDSLYCLYADRLASGAVEPRGYQHIERFFLDGTIPVWEFAVAETLLEKRVWMEQGKNTTFVRYKYLRPGSSSIQLQLRLNINARIDHHTTHANQAGVFDCVYKLRSIAIQTPGVNTKWFIHASNGVIKPGYEWKRNYYLEAEAARGQNPIEDCLFVGTLEEELLPGESVTLVLSTEADVELDSNIACANRKVHEHYLLDSAHQLRETITQNGAAIDQLILAADQFIVRRPTTINADGKTILAGYHWFSDWGRDTMISLAGLTLATGRPEIARSVLWTFASFVDKGMLPNQLPLSGENPEYNTADATLWFFEAIRAYIYETHDFGFLQDVFAVLQDIIQWHLKGTRFNIHCDQEDYLLFAGSNDNQLTWMDVKIGDWAVTPRPGKAVEINALWYNALCAMAEFSNLLGYPGDIYTKMCNQVERSFIKFWNSSEGYLFDVIDGPEGCDPSLRPNQIMAVSIHFSPLTPEHQKAVVDVCVQNLLTSFGLRSLAQNHPAYIGHYGGDRWRRDTAYHQGTVWSWLIGPLISAHLRVYQDPKIARSYLQPLLDQLSDHGLGSISEIFSGDPPFTPEGCIAQAWSVAEILRSYKEILRYENSVNQVGDRSVK